MLAMHRAPHWHEVSATVTSSLAKSRPSSGPVSMAGVRMRGRAIGKFGATRALLTWMVQTLRHKWQAPGGNFWAEKPATARKRARRGPTARPSQVWSPEGAAAGEGRTAGTLGAKGCQREGSRAGFCWGSSGGRGRGLGSRARPCTHNAGEIGVFRVRHGGGEAGLGDRGLGGAGAGDRVGVRLGPGPRLRRR